MTSNLPFPGGDKTGDSGGHRAPDSGDFETKDVQELVEGTSLWQDAWKRLRRNRAAMAGFLVIVVMAMSAIFYEQIVEYGTRFHQDEQHPYVMPKPPGSYSVPSEHFRLIEPDELSFEEIDREETGELDAEDVYHAYRRWEFDRIDRSGDGKLDWDEYSRAPFSLPADTVPDCERWNEIRQSMAPIDAREIFECDAGDDGYLHYEDAGLLIEIVNLGEARDIVRHFDESGTGVVEPHEFHGLPRPERNWLGTDQLGRDLLTRLVFGGRISLAVGLAATLVAFLIGVTYGATSGFLGGKIDRLMMRFVDVLYGLPFIFLVILLVAVFGQNIILLFVALGAVQWLTMARIVRGQVISLKGQEFVDAARTIGVSKPAIIFRHLIPNALGPIIVYATLTVPAVILAEAFLSFLGLGVQAPHTSWGALASEGRQVMEMAPWMIIWPGLALAVTLLALNFLGDGLRDALDPQLRED